MGIIISMQELGPFPAGIVLHSWAGPAEMVAPFSKIDGVYFSISGHLTHLKTDKAAATVQQVQSAAAIVAHATKTACGGRAVLLSGHASRQSGS